MDGCGISQWMDAWRKRGQKMAGRGVRGKITESRMANNSRTNEMGVFIQPL